MHIGVHTNYDVLENKFRLHEGPRSQVVTLSIASLPEELSTNEENRLFVAVSEKWIGYFVLEDELRPNPDDPARPYSLVFDTVTWVQISPVDAKPCTGFTSDTPGPDEIVPIR